MARCFVAMPITTPEVYAKQLNDSDHFIHVLDYLFKPALVRGSYEVISPISTGSELIPASIIKNLEQCELVLCDISALNPNVFFELGIRTALDKPVAIVRDSLTPTLPFDTSSINVHMYDVGLRPWLLESEIAKLAEHISITHEKSAARNSLWRFFGLTQKAEPAKEDDPVQAKLDLLLGEVSQLRKASEQSPASMVGTYGIGFNQSGIPVATTGASYVNPITSGISFYGNAGSIWGAPNTTYNPNFIPIDSAPKKYQDFVKQAKAFAAREGATLMIEGYDSASFKVIMNTGNWPISDKAVKEIASAGQKLKVDYELRALP